MATNWPQGGQSSVAMHSNNSHYPQGSHDRNGPPPICFRCGNQGHFVIDCPHPTRSNPGGPLTHASGSYPSNGNSSSDGNQRAQCANGGKMSAPGATVTRYPVPKNTAVVTRYAVPDPPTQYGNAATLYGPPPSAVPYQQYPGSLQPSQPYLPPAQTSYFPQQYGSSAPPYSHHQPPQSYGPHPATPNYGHQEYQPSPYNQYPPTNGPPQYNNPGYQNPPHQYTPPAAPYQQPTNQFPQRNGSYSGLPPQQWNNITPASSLYNAPAYQQASNVPPDSGYQRDYSRTSSYQSYQQQTPHQEFRHESVGYQQTPQTPASSFNANGAAHAAQSSTADGSYFPNNSNESVASSRASTPYAKCESSSDHAQNGRAARSATPSLKARHSTKESAKEEAEEGELSEQDLLQEQFNWDFKKIFQDPPPPESVGLAQPLSTTFDMTPVPLLDPRSSNSVSRYARKENLKEFTRPIRSQPQWSYLQEDPAFSDALMEGPLIPLSEVPSWTAKRQGIEDFADNRRPSTSSRKRAWSDAQEDADNQIKLEAATYQQDEEEKPAKRQKNGEPGEESPIIVDKPGTPTAITPIIGRVGTPSFGADDDVWAPQPGEGAASTPLDPTEALLASLGVTGSPKPVRQDSDPPVLIPVQEHYATSPYGSLPLSNSPQANPPTNMTQGNHPHSNSSENIPPQRPPQGSPSYGNTSYTLPQQSSSPYGSSSYSNPSYNIPQQGNTLYGDSGLPQYNNSMSPQSNNTQAMPQFGSAHGNLPRGAPQRPPSYSNPQFGSPHGHHSNGFQPQGVPNYGNGVAQNGDPSYGMPPQVGPPYRNPPHAISPQVQHPYGISPQGNPSYGNAAMQSNPPYPPFNNQDQANQPSRHDSGYISARGSYSNGSGSNGFYNNDASQNGGRETPRIPFDGAGDTPSPQEKEKSSQSNLEAQDSSNEPNESPLSPTSAEILGKLAQQTRKPSNGKKSEPLRQADDTARRSKRPQPVVAEAYSRRW